MSAVDVFRGLTLFSGILVAGKACQVFFDRIMAVYEHNKREQRLLELEDSERESMELEQEMLLQERNSINPLLDNENEVAQAWTGAEGLGLEEDAENQLKHKSSIQTNSKPPKARGTAFGKNDLHLSDDDEDESSEMGKNWSDGSSSQDPMADAAQAYLGAHVGSGHSKPKRKNKKTVLVNKKGLFGAMKSAFKSSGEPKDKKTQNFKIQDSDDDEDGKGKQIKIAHRKSGVGKFLKRQLIDDSDEEDFSEDEKEETKSKPKSSPKRSSVYPIQSNYDPENSMDHVDSKKAQLDVGKSPSSISKLGGGTKNDSSNSITLSRMKEYASNNGTSQLFVPGSSITRKSRLGGGGSSTNLVAPGQKEEEIISLHNRRSILATAMAEEKHQGKKKGGLSMMRKSNIGVVDRSKRLSAMPQKIGRSLHSPAPETNIHSRAESPHGGSNIERSTKLLDESRFSTNLHSGRNSDTSEVSASHSHQVSNINANENKQADMKITINNPLVVDKAMSNDNINKQCSFDIKKQQSSPVTVMKIITTSADDVSKTPDRNSEGIPSLISKPDPIDGSGVPESINKDHEEKKVDRPFIIPNITFSDDTPVNNTQNANKSENDKKNIVSSEDKKTNDDDDIRHVKKNKNDDYETDNDNNNDSNENKDDDHLINEDVRIQIGPSDDGPSDDEFNRNATQDSLNDVINVLETSTCEVAKESSVFNDALLIIEDSIVQSPKDGNRPPSDVASEEWNLEMKDNVIQLPLGDKCEFNKRSYSISNSEDSTNREVLLYELTYGHEEPLGIQFTLEPGHRHPRITKINEELVIQGVHQIGDKLILLNGERPGNLFQNKEERLKLPSLFAQRPLILKFRRTTKVNKT